jgi:CRISPR/Cas system CSM-associated protein Csm5 (group 7 of RAMP superfamily)
MFARPLTIARNTNKLTCSKRVQFHDKLQTSYQKPKLTRSYSEKTDKPKFQWDDPLLLQSSFTDEELVIQEQVRAYCQEKLMPRILEQNREAKFVRSVINEMGEMGMLGPTIKGIISTNSIHLLYFIRIRLSRCQFCIIWINGKRSRKGKKITNH